ncbi:hypothetical protein [Herminiimonas sp. CN]|uniref:hypothetical protein n=1 Tax=Herminiimonas sp. CN TaxID=1349818 RepID=UPI00047418E5|nr:hypothetical protein [Herminiimonas sp. CN]
MRAAFYKSTRPGMQGIYNRLVRLGEKGPHSHCELIFSDGVAASASYMDGGVRFKQIDFNDADWDFVELPDHLEPAARQWFTDHEGQAYDLLGNARFPLIFLPLSRDKSFCSSAVASALGISGGWRFGPNALHSVLRSMSI